MIQLDSYSTAIIHLSKKDKHLAELIRNIGPLQYINDQEPYAFLVEAIIGQMLSNKVAQILAGRLRNSCHGSLAPYLISALSDDQLGAIGISRAKVRYIRHLTDAVENGTLNLNALYGLSDQQIMKELTAIHGIGNWTAKMFLIFVCDRLDVLPTEDLAFIQAYQWLYHQTDLKPAAIQHKCRKWKPYSSIAARFLYCALDQGLTKTPFRLHKKLNDNR